MGETVSVIDQNDWCALFDHLSQEGEGHHCKGSSDDEDQVGLLHYFWALVETFGKLLSEKDDIWLDKSFTLASQDLFFLDGFSPDLHVELFFTGNAVGTS